MLWGLFFMHGVISSKKNITSVKFQLNSNVETFDCLFEYTFCSVNCFFCLIKWILRGEQTKETIKNDKKKWSDFFSISLISQYIKDM